MVKTHPLIVRISYESILNAHPRSEAINKLAQLYNPGFRKETTISRMSVQEYHFTEFPSTFIERAFALGDYVQGVHITRNND